MSDATDLDDIPGTVVFTGAQSRRGFHLNQFCMSLTRPANRARFKADEEAYLDRLTADPQALRRIPHIEYLREAGTEGIEMVMWLIMRGALGDDVAELHRHYHVPASNTAVGHLVLRAA